jgi:hypothetical protein
MMSSGITVAEEIAEEYQTLGIWAGVKIAIEKGTVIRRLEVSFYLFFLYFLSIKSRKTKRRRRKERKKTNKKRKSKKTLSRSKDFTLDQCPSQKCEKLGIDNKKKKIFSFVSVFPASTRCVPGTHAVPVAGRSNHPAVRRTTGDGGIVHGGKYRQAHSKRGDIRTPSARQGGSGPVPCAGPNH